MREGEAEKIRLGVSACLLGEPVRYDGGHRRDSFLCDTLGPRVEWVPVCPEVELRLGVPRPPMHLVGDARAPRLVVESTGEDFTMRMRDHAAARARELTALGLDGFVLKRNSPSCGLLAVPVHDDGGAASGEGRGLFAAALVEALPALPVEEEARLADAAIRERFLARVLAARAERLAQPRPARDRLGGSPVDRPPRSVGR